VQTCVAVVLIAALSPGASSPPDPPDRAAPRCLEKPAIEGTLQGHRGQSFERERDASTTRGLTPHGPAHPECWPRFTAEPGRIRPVPAHCRGQLSSTRATRLGGQGRDAPGDQRRR
jgi:hypothetical protein